MVAVVVVAAVAVALLHSNAVEAAALVAAVEVVAAVAVALLHSDAVEAAVLAAAAVAAVVGGGEGV